jgi:hypothetical protein
VTGRLCRDLPIFENYSGANGARVELHPWFYIDGRQYLGLTRVLPPGTGRAPAHMHTVTQRSVLLRGTAARFRRGGRPGTLTAGEEVIIPPGLRHVDPYNDTGEPIVVRTLYSPGPVWLLSYGRMLGRAIRDGRVGAQQELPLLHLLLMLGSPGSVTRAAFVPAALQRHVLLPLAGRLARRRGYAPTEGLREHIFG